MLDSTDRKSETLSKAELYNLLANDVRAAEQNLSKAAFLVFANKQDMPEAMTEDEIIAKLNLGELKNHTWHIQKCSALTGMGVDEGLDWLHEKLVEKHGK